MKVMLTSPLMVLILFLILLGLIWTHPKNYPGRKMLYYFLVIMAVSISVSTLAGTIPRFINRFFLLRTGKGPAGPKVPALAFQHKWREGKVLLVGLGDSITDGFGASLGRGYFELLIHNDDKLIPDMKGKYLSTVFPSLSARNLSVSCSVSAEHLNDQLPLLERQPDDVFGIVVITTGGNDLIHDYGTTEPRDGAMYGCTYEQGELWANNFRKRLEMLLDGVKERFPGGCEIFLANIYDPTDGIGDIHRAPIPLPPWPDGIKILSLFNEHIREAAEARSFVHLVDIHSEFLGHGIHCRDRHNPHYRRDDPFYWYYSNLEDPNDRGYDAIRRLFLLEMIKVFAENGQVKFISRN